MVTSGTKMEGGQLHILRTYIQGMFKIFTYITYIYCLYVGVDYTYIDINALAQGIKSFLASQVWYQAVAGARTYGTDSPAITSLPR